MKKRELVKQNIQLFTQLDSASAEVENLKKKLNETREKLNSVTSELEELKSRIEAEKKENCEQESEEAEKAETSENTDTAPAESQKPVNQIDSKVEEFKIAPAEHTPQPELREDLAYAADTIGKIVIESAKYSNRLTADGNSEYMELVNLILGKTEVAKSEILSVTREPVPFSAKKEKIDAVKTAAIEYFDSVMAQRI